MGLIFSEAGKAFSKALKLRPDDFKLEGTHRLLDTKTKFEWWIANGAWFFDFNNGITASGTQPKHAKFGLIERHWWYQHFIWWKRKRYPNKNSHDLEAAVKLAMVINSQETNDER